MNRSLRESYSPARPAKGLTMTSKVAFEGCSAAGRTSIGPETEARALVSPSKCLLAHIYIQIYALLSPKPNRAEPSTPSSPSKQVVIFRVSVSNLPSGL